MHPHSEPSTLPAIITVAGAPIPPVARTVEQTCAHYGWSRSYLFRALREGTLEARKAGRLTLISTESADRLYAGLPRQTYRAPLHAAAA